MNQEKRIMQINSQGFIASYPYPAITGNFTYFQVRNPPGSGITAVVNSIKVLSNATGFNVVLNRKNTSGAYAGATNAHRQCTKLQPSLLPQCTVTGHDAATGPTDINTIVTTTIPTANEWNELIPDTCSLILSEDESIVVDARTAARALWYVVQWEEL